MYADCQRVDAQVTAIKEEIAHVNLQTSNTSINRTIHHWCLVHYEPKESLGTSKERMEFIMGFRKPMDYNSVHHQVYMAGVELNSPYNDGFNQWEIKKDLYKLKWLLDEILVDSGNFTGEEKFVKEHEQVKMWKTLSK